VEAEGADDGLENGIRERPSVHGGVLRRATRHERRRDGEDPEERDQGDGEATRAEQAPEAVE
jgi:hypothetical protein